MTQVKFRLAAYTDAAGRYNPEAPRSGNEDNMFVNADLGAPEGSAFFESDKEMVLTEYGCILVVADGMGGMNAGEVASEIAVNVVKESFSKETIPHSAMASGEEREKYLRRVVVMADEAVKRHAASHTECEGMGSTLVMAWLYGKEASLAWLGDSRIYLFREPGGLRQVSKDHSYVQELVDKGKITQEEAFIHPYNNVITRSLGDMSKTAEADSLTIKLFKDDILLLNSDGLSGVLHDDEMGQIIRANRATMSSCRAALWKAAEDAGWHDNVTAVICEITEGDKLAQISLNDTLTPDETIKPEDDELFESKGSKTKDLKRKNHILRAILAVVSLLFAVALFYWLRNTRKEGEKESVERTESYTPASVPIQHSSQEVSESEAIKTDIKKSPERSLKSLLKSVKPSPDNGEAKADSVMLSMKKVTDSARVDSLVESKLPVLKKDDTFPKLEPDTKLPVESNDTINKREESR